MKGGFVMKKEQAKENIDFVLTTLQQAMKISGVAIGFDLVNKKLVLQDVKTELISRVDLEELNKILIN